MISLKCFLFVFKGIYLHGTKFKRYWGTSPPPSFAPQDPAFPQQKYYSSCGSFQVHSSLAHVPLVHPVLSTETLSQDITVMPLTPLGLPTPFSKLRGLPAPDVPRAGPWRPRTCSPWRQRPALQWPRAPPRASPAGPAGEEVAAAAVASTASTASTAAPAVGAQAPKQDGGASAAFPRSGLDRRPPAAGRPLQPPAQAPVGSTALSGSGQGGAAAGCRAPGLGAGQGRWGGGVRGRGRRGRGGLGHGGVGAPSQPARLKVTAVSAP